MLVPQLCKTIKHPDLAKNWIGYTAEPKHDGMRALLVVDLEGNIDILSRTGHSQLGKFPHLEVWLSKEPSLGLILDGELAHISRTEAVFGADVPVVDFNKTMRVCGSQPSEAVRKQMIDGRISFIAFDILQQAGQDLTVLEQRLRRTILVSLLQALEPTSHVILNPEWYVPSQLPKLCERIEVVGCEGLILKNQAATYTPGGRPNKVWYKVKKRIEFDVVVIGYTPGAGKYSGQIGAIVFGAVDSKGVVQQVAKCSGMTDSERREITEHQTEYRGRVFVVSCNDLVGSGKYRTPRHPN